MQPTASTPEYSLTGRTEMSRVKSVAIATTIGCALGGLFLAGPANAAYPASKMETSPKPCPTTKTSVTKLVNRPDGGNHDVWATDTITRTVVFTKVEAPKIEALQRGPVLWSYHADVKDEGTFVTVDGKSPNKGVDLAAGTHGTVSGHFTADFTAEECFANFANTFGGDTYHGKAPVSTSEWVKADWGGTDFEGASINNDWSWVYKTCSESWLDAYNNKDGTADGAGDIVGEPCPSSSASASASASASTSPSASRSTGGGVVVVPVDNSSLPVTGSNLVYPIGGASLLALGGLLWFLTRKRRTKFEA